MVNRSDVNHERQLTINSGADRLCFSADASHGYFAIDSLFGEYWLETTAVCLGPCIDTAALSPSYRTISVLIHGEVDHGMCP